MDKEVTAALVTGYEKAVFLFKYLGWLDLVLCYLMIRI